MARAEKEGKPLLVAFLMDHEPANDETIEKIYPDPEVAKVSAKFVCLACCSGDHKSDDGMCPRFPGITCAQHKAIEIKARARWLVGEDVCAPQHVFCDSKGHVVSRKVYFIAKQALTKAMAFALNTVSEDPESRRVVDQEKVRVDQWLKDIESKNQGVRDPALVELGITEDPRALPAVLGIAKSGNATAARDAAIAALARKGNFAAVKPLTAMLSDPKPPVLIRLARTLEVIQMPDAAPGLMNAYKKERRDRVRGFLLRAAARSTPNNAAVRDACLAALKKASAQLEPCVLVALGRLNADAAIVEGVRPLLKDKNQNTRALAIWVLGSQATHDSESLIQELLEDEKAPEVVSIAASALKRCRGEKVDGYDNLFTTFFSDSDY
jgi:HEAT repeat protein